MANEPVNDPLSTLTEIERRVGGNSFQFLNLFGWIILVIFIIFLTVTLLGGIDFLTKKSNIFSSNETFRITLLKNRNFLFEYEKENNKEFRFYNSSTGILTDLSKGNKFLKALYESDNGFISLEKINGETKIKYETDNHKRLSIDSRLFTDELDKRNEDIYSFCPWSDIKSYHQKIAFFVCSSKKSKLMTISLNDNLRADTVTDSTIENIEDARIIEWIDEDRILFSKLNSKEDISIIEYNFTSKESKIIYGY